MMSAERKELTAGIAALLCAVSVFSLFGGRQARNTVSSYTVGARFNQIQGLDVGADVRLAGIPVGTVAKQELDDHYGVVVTLKLPSSVLLPEDTGASVQTNGVLGKKYIELTPGGSEEMLEDGAFLDFTEDSPDLKKLIDKVIAMSNPAKNKKQVQ